jgi:hypothetical protein
MKEKIINRNRFYFLVLVILVNLAIYWKWFFTFGIMTHGDWGFLFAESVKENFLHASIWSESGLGSLIITSSSYPVRFIWGFLSFFMDFGLSERVLYLWPSVLVTSIGIFFLINKICRTNISALVGSFVYTYSTYFIVGRTGSLTLEVGFALAPIFLLLFIICLEKMEFRYLVLTACVGTLLGYFEFRVLYLVTVICGLYFIFDILTSVHDRKIIFKKILYSAFIYIIILLNNFFWLLALSVSKSISNNDVFNRGLFGNEFMSITKSITSFHPFWSGGKFEFFVLQEIPAYFFILPLLAFLGLILNRHNKKVVFFGIVGLLGVLLGKQVGEPFPNLYEWLYLNLPGFNAFREASKMYFFIALGYSVLAASFIDWIWLNWTKSTFHFFSKLFLTALLLLVILWNAKSVINLEIGSILVESHVPVDYLILREKIISENQNYRTLWIPRDSRFGFYTNMNPKINAIDIIGGLWKNITYNIYDSSASRIANVISKKYLNSILDISSIKFVIVPIQDIQNDDDFFQSYGGRQNPNIRQWYIDKLDKISWLKKVDMGFTELVVYENKNYKQPIFVFDNLFNLDSMQGLEGKYALMTDNLKKEFYFNTLTNSTTTKSIGLINLFETILVNNFNSTAHSIKVPLENFDPGIDKIVYRNYVGGYWKLDKQNNFIYTNWKYKFANEFSNGSFEDGLWQNKVGDCNNNDKNPILGMSTSSKSSDGIQSLQLEATRHIACTNIKIKVNPNSIYQLSFDYQSPNTGKASYHLDFDNLEKENFTDNLTIVGKDWNKYYKTIKTPKGVSEISLTLYAKSLDNKTNIINRYDNFSLVEIPDLSDSYYLVSEPKEKLVKPKDITFELLNPTKKIVHIKGATTGFFLGMSESYHPQWQAQFNNNKINGFWNSWIPFVKPDKIPEEYHYKLDDFLNAWHIDVDKYCRENNLCVKNMDGSYDIEMVVEFFPQRWFYLGLLISGTTLFGCLLYLGYEGIRVLVIKYKKIYEIKN